MIATDIVRSAIANTPPYHIERLWAELAEHSSVRGGAFLRNLTPQLAERTVLNAQWEPRECTGLTPYERLYLARGILGVAADGRRTAHITVLVMRGADGNDFVAWLWPGDPAGEAELRAA
jgi:hypothetical protein